MVRVLPVMKIPSGADKSDHCLPVGSQRGEASSRHESCRLEASPAARQRLRPEDSVQQSPRREDGSGTTAQLSTNMGKSSDCLSDQRVSLTRRRARLAARESLG